jgi:hypothetical protein
MGAAGPAIIFMCLFVLTIIVGLATLTYASRCVLVVVQETGQGQDEINWPNEPMQDWLGHAVQFIELLGIWLAPAALAARMLRNVWLPEDAALRVLLLAGPGLWLFLPIGLLSSLSAQSRWVPLRWAIVVCFLRVAPAALVFYLLTAFLLSAAVVPWYYSLFRGQVALLAVAAGVSATVLFIYARLLGRLALIIQRLPMPERAPAKTKARAPKRPPPRGKKKRKTRPDAQDPWAIPEEEERERKKSERYPWAKEKPKTGYHVPSAQEIEGYGFASEQPPAPEPAPEKPTRSRFAQTPEEYEAYDVRGTPEPVAPAQREPQDVLFAEQVRQRIAERTRTQSVLPAHPFFNGVYTFPFYSACLGSWIALSLAFLAEGGIVHQMLEVGRTLFHW